MLGRRQFLGAGLAAALATPGCDTVASALDHIQGGFVGAQPARGHWLREGLASGQSLGPPARVFQTKVVIVGGGVAGLAAARALRLRGVDDFAVLDMEDIAGGNSRASSLDGLVCPLGAHYLPLPGDDAPEVQDLLEELGLRQRLAGRWQYDERHLCHSPQERLFFQGQWQEGLLPLNGVGEGTLVQYRRFSMLVQQAQAAARWTMPVQKEALAPVKYQLVAITFAAYLSQNGLDDPHLRWYLDYCCRDDYGAGIASVSAWAGIHYFASRHGFHVPGAESAEREGLLTWPEGNAYLTRKLAAPLGERLKTGRTVISVAHTKAGVAVDAFNTANQTLERWQARRAVVALPVFVAARVVQNPPDFLRQAAAQVVYAPWLVANIHIREPLHDRPGAAPSWDNVLYGEPDSATTATPQGGLGTGLGYVDAGHQLLQTQPGATVLTHYRALGDGVALPASHAHGAQVLATGGSASQAGAPSPADTARALAQAGRSLLLARPWSAWRDSIMAELAQAHPDLATKTTAIDITRYGHAMATPLPNAQGLIGLWPPSNMTNTLLKKEQLRARPVLAWERLAFAHSDWAGYSVFEEAFTAGHSAGHWVAG